MKITSAKFIASAQTPASFLRDRRKEVAFLGRSNVGKSSLMNSLLGVRGLARTSSTPGRTQALNFFVINRKFRFVDLPGYGYARAPRAVKQKWSAAADDYLAKREQLVLSIHIVDSRHEPTKHDLQLQDWLKHYQRSNLIVATKSDKLSNNELRRNIARLIQAFAGTDPIIYSATNGRGREELWSAIEKSLKR